MSCEGELILLFRTKYSVVFCLVRAVHLNFLLNETPNKLWPVERTNGTSYKRSACRKDVENWRWRSLGGSVSS